MSVIIENYRGFEISFDTDKESFMCYSGDFDREEGKKSYAAAKKWVDDFLKENTTFKRVLIEGVIGGYRDMEKYTLTGIRKDLAFMAEGVKGAFQISKYDEQKYAVYEARFTDVRAKYNEYQKRIKDLQKERDDYMEANYRPITLDLYKKQLLGL